MQEETIVCFRETIVLWNGLNFCLNMHAFKFLVIFVNLIKIFSFPLNFIWLFYYQIILIIYLLFKLLL